MTINRKVVSALSPMIETRDIKALKEKTGNIYESVVIASKRASQISISEKEELHRKLDDFANHSDSLEEIHENKEQIEISRFYERQPNAVLQALNEFNEDKIYYRKKEEEV